jgi:PD-(D/E)XK nuclease superfamily
MKGYFDNMFNIRYRIFVQEEKRIAREVVDAALKLHRHFGPGIYESVYEPVLAYELKKRASADACSAYLRGSQVRYWVQDRCSCK